MTPTAGITVRFSEPFLAVSQDALTEQDRQTIAQYLATYPDAGSEIEGCRHLFQLPWTPLSEAGQKVGPGIVIYMAVPGAPRIDVLNWVPDHGAIAPVAEKGKGPILRRIAFIGLALERLYRLLEDVL